MKFALSNGDFLELTLSMRKQYELEQNKPDVYKKFVAARGRIMKSGGDMEKLSDLDAAQVVYAAYVCGLDDMAQAIDYMDFLDLLEDDWTDAVNAAIDIMTPKKKTASVKPSKVEPDGSADEK